MPKKILMGCKELKVKLHKSILADIKSLELPKPDHSYGFSTSLLQESISSSEFKKFCFWMNGQTCILDDKLGVINYTTDVIRGLKFIRHGTPTFWD